MQDLKLVDVVVDIILYHDLTSVKSRFTENLKEDISLEENSIREKIASLLYEISETSPKDLHLSDETFEVLATTLKKPVFGKEPCWNWLKRFRMKTLSRMKFFINNIFAITK